MPVNGCLQELHAISACISANNGQKPAKDVSEENKSGKFGMLTLMCISSAEAEAGNRTINLHTLALNSERAIISSSSEEIVTSSPSLSVIIDKHITINTEETKLISIN